jgi:hypothetical protein
VDEIGFEAFDDTVQSQRQGKRHREVASMEVLNRSHSDDAWLDVGSALEGRRGNEHAMAPIPKPGGRRFDAPGHPAHVGEVRVRHHDDVHSTSFPRSLLDTNGRRREQQETEQETGFANRRFAW